jgi:pimeloyl-ACP methyl ester carboxylesterase
LTTENKNEIPEFGHYVDVNGIHMYYEDRGEGSPLILIHGGLATAELGWGDLREEFLHNFRVIAPDSRGLGRTNNPQKTFSYQLMREDIVALIKSLDLKDPIICGWSDGGQIALEIGIRYPDIPRALIIGGALHKVTEPNIKSIKSIPDMVKSSPELLNLLKKAHSQVYGPEYLEPLLEQLMQMWIDPKGFPNEDIKLIKTPSLIILGDGDEFIPLEIQLEMHKLIPNSELAIIPNMKHGNYVDERKEIFSTVVLDFLERICSQN